MSKHGALREEGWWQDIPNVRARKWLLKRNWKSRQKAKNANRRGVVPRQRHVPIGKAAVEAYDEYTRRLMAGDPRAPHYPKGRS